MNLRLDAPVGFSLAAAADFYAGFQPMGGAATRDARTLSLAFLLDGTFSPVAVTLAQEGRELRAAVTGAVDESVLRIQLSRMLGLDVDGAAWAEVGVRDPVVGGLQRAFPGFFTAAFPSPYEAGLSALLSHRSSIAQASAIRRRLAAAHGESVGGISVVPAPRVVLALSSFSTVPKEKWERIRAFARAAGEGRLEAERLRALPAEFALAQLQALPGVGPWTAAHVWMRGAAPRDALPVHEERVLRGFSLAYGVDAAEFAKRAEAWRPFRMWVGVLLSRNLMRSGQWSVGFDSVSRREASRVTR